jgi:hypothetical protein
MDSNKTPNNPLMKKWLRGGVLAKKQDYIAQLRGQGVPEAQIAEILQPQGYGGLEKKEDQVEPADTSEPESTPGK